MTEIILLEKVYPDHWESLQRIGRFTFFETFSDHNTEEDMKNYLADSFSKEKLHSELTDPGSEYYFARVGDEIAGYLKVNVGNAQTEQQPGNTLEIERIYVSAVFHGKLVAQRLYEKAIALAAEKKADYV